MPRAAVYQNGGSPQQEPRRLQKWGDTAAEEPFLWFLRRMNGSIAVRQCPCCHVSSDAATNDLFACRPTFLSRLLYDFFAQRSFFLPTLCSFLFVTLP